jgi:hypothetical protein
MQGDTTRTRRFCSRAILISMHPMDLQLPQSAALSFKTHLRTNTFQRHLAHSWSAGEPSIGFLRADPYVPARPRSIVRFQLPIIIRSPSS